MDAEAPKRKTRGPNVAGERARDALIDQATALFAKHGYSGISTREITKEANINQASIHYYFGTKRELFLAAVAKHFNHISLQRYAMLDAACADGPPTLEAVLRALIAPHVRFVTHRNGKDYLRIYATFGSTPDDIIEEIYAKHFNELRSRFLEAIAAAVPDLPREDLHRAFSFITNMLVTALFDPGYKVMTGRKPHIVDVENFIELMVTYNAAGVRAIAAEAHRQAPAQAGSSA